MLQALKRSQPTATLATWLGTLPALVSRSASTHIANTPERTCCSAPLDPLGIRQRVRRGKDAAKGPPCLLALGGWRRGGTSGSAAVDFDII